LKRLLSFIVVAILATSLLPMYAFETKAETQSISVIQDPTPGYYETSEYMIGKVAVGIILPESNGTIDPNTEDWSDEEIEQVLIKIQFALDWWTSQNTFADVSFVTEVHARVPTRYELINHNFTDPVRALAYNEIMTYLGYEGECLTQIRNYINDLRYKLNTEWSFVMFIVDASNDSDGRYADGFGASADPGGPSLQVPVKTTDNLDWRVAHEMGHIFWATDEYNGRTEYCGYLNVPDVEGSNCLMQTPGSWNLSGKPHGMNGTWGQVGWRDSDGDGIQDIVDTPQRVYLNSYVRIGNRINFTGTAAVTPIKNKNPWTWNPEGKRDITINKIQSVQFRVDNGIWQNASMTPWKFKKLVKYPDTYEYKETYAVVNFTFLTPELSPGEHFIEVKATNQWGNEGYANATVTIPAYLKTDLNKDGVVNIMDIAIVAKAYGAKHNETDGLYWHSPSCNSCPHTKDADLNEDKIINIIDIATVARDYGKTT
jgi:hypothetical protein